MKSVLEKDFGSSKSVFGFRVLLGNPKSEIQNRNPDFPIERTLKLLGVTIDTRLNFNEHINCVCKKTSQGISVLMRLKNLIPTMAKLQLKYNGVENAKKKLKIVKLTRTIKMKVKD